MISNNRPVELYDLAPAADDFRAEVLAGFAAPHKSLPCKYFYDEAGSKLFERICGLPEYYPTRTELAILHRDSPAMAALLGPRCLVVEYGSGNTAKTRPLLDHLIEPAAYVPVDISREQLLNTARALARDYPALEIHPVWADFASPLRLPPARQTAARRVVYFPGSTIGNFTPPEAHHLMRQTAQLCGSGGALLLGADLKKDPHLLHAAYNDSQGITAAFNLNLLVRINRELGSNFQVDSFWHYAFYNPGEGRVEMYLVSSVEQRVIAAGHQVYFAEGEPICTEYSYKYNLDDLLSIAEPAGFRLRQAWTDERKYFGVFYLTVDS